MKRKEEKVDIVGVKILIANNPRQYAIRYSYDGAQRIIRRLKDKSGRLFPTHDGVYIVDGYPVNETPQMMVRVVAASNITSNQMGDERMFSKTSRLLFGDCLKKYIADRERLQRRDPGFHNLAKSVAEKWGATRIDAITRSVVKQWIAEDLEPTFSFTTIKHRVDVGNKLFNWMAKEEIWSGGNPFAKQEWSESTKDRGLFIKMTVGAEEWQMLRNMAADSDKLMQAMMIEYHTGIRPSEATRIGFEDFDHANLTLSVLVTKLKGRPIRRLIAIPQSLSVWAINWNEQGRWRTLKPATISTAMQRLVKGVPSLNGVTQESFRNNFASMAELAGVPHSVINAHQGRDDRGSVLVDYYLKDKYRAVNLMRPYLPQIFGEETKLIVVSNGTKPGNE